jgi:hypothetical protein
MQLIKKFQKNNQKTLTTRYSLIKRLVFGLDLENLVKKFYHDVKLEVVFRTANDIGKCFPFKSKERGHPEHMQSFLVYHFKCSDFNEDKLKEDLKNIVRFTKRRNI